MLIKVVCDIFFFVGYNKLILARFTQNLKMVIVTLPSFEIFVRILLYEYDCCKNPLKFQEHIKRCAVCT